MTKLDLIFIYGTLLPAFENPMSHWLKQNSEPITEGYMTGLLYQVSDYPGAIYIPNSVTKVFGLVLKMTDSQKVLKKLDDYEGADEEYPQTGEYIRQMITIYGFDGLKRKCWVYLYNREIQSLKQIISGDYFTFYHCNF